MINGVIFQKKNNNTLYRGVDGENWYLNSEYPETIGLYFDENIEKSWFESNYVDVCYEDSFINKYIELSQKKNIEFRILLCSTNCIAPVYNNNDLKLSFLGYDYAYSGGSYYSAVYNDLYCRKINELTQIKLNENGLIQTKEELEKFIAIRNKLKASSTNKNIFEEGYFIEYELFDVVLQNTFQMK